MQRKRINELPLYQQIQNELFCAARHSTPYTRVAGIGSLLVLMVWINSSISALRDVRNSLALVNASSLMGSFFQYDTPVLEHGSMPQTTEEALAIANKRHEQRIQQQSQQAETNRGTMQRNMKVQGFVTSAWVVLLVLVGAFMLGGAVSGLMGSAAVRVWHRLVVYWTLLAAAGIVAGILLLAQWGGFPHIANASELAGVFLDAEAMVGPPMLHLFAIQGIYLIIIIVSLLLTRQTASMEWITKIS